MTFQIFFFIRLQIGLFGMQVVEVAIKVGADVGSRHDGALDELELFRHLGGVLLQLVHHFALRPYLHAHLSSSQAKECVRHTLDTLFRHTV